MKKASILTIALIALPVTGGEQGIRLSVWQADKPQEYSLKVRDAVWLVPMACLPSRDLGANAGGRDLGANASGRDLGANAGGRDLGASAGGRDLGANASERDLGANAGGRDLGANASGRDLGANASGRDLGADQGGRDLGSGADWRDLGADAGFLRCELDERQESVIIHGAEARDITLPEGSRFKKVSTGPEENSARIYL